MSSLIVLRSQPATAAENMAKDKELLENMDSDDPILLHLYSWSKPSITYGHFISIDEHLDTGGLQEMGWSLAKRPTGGGILIHSWDLTFSLLIPSSSSFYKNQTLKSYSFINKIAAQALASIDPTLSEDIHLFDPNSKKPSPQFCMSDPTIYDLLYKNAKILGAAQRRKQQGILHQCSINIKPPCYTKLLPFFKRSAVIDAIEHQSGYLEPLSPRFQDKKVLEDHLIEQIEIQLFNDSATISK